MIKLSGLTPAVFTPFDKTGAINLAQIQPYADKLVTDGADGVFVCGSTGECTSMTIAERKSVLEAWVNATSGRMRVIAHVGGTCQADCIELARHAAGLGVDAVGAIAPFYFKPASVGELVAFYKPIAAAIAPIPFYSYHMPSVTGINLPMKEFLEKYEDIDVVISENDNMTFGAIEAIREAGRTIGSDGDIIILSFDAVRDALKAIQTGDIAADFECNPLTAPLVEETIRRLEAGESVEKIQYVEETYFDCEMDLSELLESRPY